MWYYSNTNNIDIVVIFISSAPSNSTACYFATPDIIAKYTNITTFSKDMHYVLVTSMLSSLYIIRLA